MRFRRLSCLVALAALVPSAARAQKKALTQADWDRWRSIQAPTLSSDGKWLAYRLVPQVGDGEFVIRATSGTTEYRIPLGFVGRPNNNPGGATGAGQGTGRGTPAAAIPGPTAGTITGGPFTSDGKWAMVITQPTREETDKAAAAQRAARAAGGGRGGAATNDTTLRTELVMVSLADGQQTRIENVQSVRLPRDNAQWMIYAVRDSAGRSDSAGGAGRGGAPAGGRGAGGGGRGGGGRGGAAGPRRTYGSAITLRNLQTGAEEKVADVGTYVFDDSAKVLAYTIESRDSIKDGVFLRTMATGKVQPLLTGPANYRSFTFDRKQQQYTFTSDRDDWGKPDAKVTVYYGTVKDTAAHAVIAAAQLGGDMHLSESASANFNRSGTVLQLTIAAHAPDSIPADSLLGKAHFDLWNWKDPTLQPQQLITAGRDRETSYQAIYNVATRKLIQTTSDSFPSLQVSDDGKYGMASTSVAYRVSSMWGDEGNDVYAVDPWTGARKLLRQKISGTAQLSVDGKYIIYYDVGHWYTYSNATGKTTDITGALKNVHFEQEGWSTPDTPAAWGLAGWTRGDRDVLVYDQFDLWQLDPAGVRPPVMVTDSFGRRQNTTLRLIDPMQDRLEERYIDPAKPLYFRAFSETTKGSGFYKDKLDVKAPPEKVLFGDFNYTAPVKAKNADMFFFTRSTFVEFPNIWVGSNWTSMTKVTDANPWQDEYNWGTAELVTWTSSDGVPLQGILYKPENFDPKKKYPLISYFYEDLSDGFNSYVPPTGRNIINATHYVSNGYLIFEPDIHYEIGHPGPSAMKSIVPGVQMLLARGYVDPKGLGLQGQSWGGYQTAYMITQTHMFSAAMAGAPVANMTSAYGGIRWSTGLARSFQYEKTQSRIGKSLWDAQQLYIENSPLFWLDNVTTPVFIMSNDGDGSVPWYQGIEMFVGLRRLGKEVYLIDYNGDDHNPVSRANQKDIAMRMQQFFDNKLMGKPAPDWMTKGIPAKDKGRDQFVITQPSGAVAPAGGGGNR